MNAQAKLHTIYQVPQAELHVAWPLAVPHLERCIEHCRGEVTLTSARDRLLRGDTSLVLVLSGEECIAATVLEICTYESGLRILNGQLIGGSRMAEWGDDLVRHCLELKKKHLCDRLRMGGRKGWERFPRFKQIYSVVEYEQ